MSSSLTFYFSQDFFDQKLESLSWRMAMKRIKKDMDLKLLRQIVDEMTRSQMTRNPRTSTIQFGDFCEFIFYEYGLREQKKRREKSKKKTQTQIKKKKPYIPSILRWHGRMVLLLAELQKSCATKQKEWDARCKSGTEELLALADNIKILNDDDALESCLPPSILRWHGRMVLHPVRDLRWWGRRSCQGCQPGSCSVFQHHAFHCHSWLDHLPSTWSATLRICSTRLHLCSRAERRLWLLKIKKHDCLDAIQLREYCLAAHWESIVLLQWMWSLHFQLMIGGCWTQITWLSWCNPIERVLSCCTLREYCLAAMNVISSFSIDDLRLLRTWIQTEPFAVSCRSKSNHLVAGSLRSFPHDSWSWSVLSGEAND